MDDSPASVGWTPKIAPTINVQPGSTTHVQLELIEGVVVEGKVVASDTGKPIHDAAVGGHSPARPEEGIAIFRIKTDTEGRYRLRLPPGASNSTCRHLRPAISHRNASPLSFQRMLERLLVRR
jgi:hypothetical protein